MSLRKINTARYHNDSEQAQKTAIEQLKFILANEEVFSNGIKDQKKLNASKEMLKQSSMCKLSPKQLSYIDSIYEIVMTKLGLGGYKGQKSKYGVNLK